MNTINNKKVLMVGGDWFDDFIPKKSLYFEELYKSICQYVKPEQILYLNSGTYNELESIVTLSKNNNFKPKYIIWMVDTLNNKNDLLYLIKEYWFDSVLVVSKYNDIDRRYSISYLTNYMHSVKADLLFELIEDFDLHVFRTSIYDSNGNNIVDLDNNMMNIFNHPCDFMYNLLEKMQTVYFKNIDKEEKKVYNYEE